MARRVLVIVGHTDLDEPFETRGFVSNPVASIVIDDANVEITEVGQVPIVGLSDEAGPDDPVISAHLLGLPDSVQVGVTYPLTAELHTQFGVAEAYDPARWLFEVGSGSGTFGGANDDQFTPNAAGSILITATHVDGHNTPGVTTAFVDDEVDPEESVFEVDFSGEANGTTLDQITTLSGHTFIEDVAGFLEVQNGGLTNTATAYRHARMIGDAPPAEYDHLFTIDLHSYGPQGQPGPQAGVLARCSQDFSQGYAFTYLAGFENKRFIISGLSGNFFTVVTNLVLPLGTHLLRARIRDAFKAMDRWNGTAWEQVVITSDNSAVGGMPGIISGGTHGPSAGVHVVSADGLGPSADPVVDTFASLYSLPASVIEAQTYDLRARLVDIGGSTVEEYNAANWTFSISSGPGTIIGPNNDVLSVGSAPATTVVLATHTNGKSDDVTVSVIAQPQPGDFPEGLKPAGHTQVIALNGSSVVLPGPMLWINSGWSLHSRFAVVSDPASKHGSVLEKRALVGDSTGWQGVQATTPNAMNFREVYFRIVLKYSTNFQINNPGEKLIYIGKKFPGQAPRSFVIGRRGNRLWWENDSGESSPGTTAGTGTGGMWLSEGIPPLTHGAYHTIEALFRVNTQGNNDGYLRMRLNGGEVPTWEHIHSTQANEPGIVLSSGVQWKNSNFFATGGSGIQGWQMVHFWGGASGTKVVNDHVRLSEFYISGKN